MSKRDRDEEQYEGESGRRSSYGGGGGNDSGAPEEDGQLPSDEAEEREARTERGSNGGGGGGETSAAGADPEETGESQARKKQRVTEDGEARVSQGGGGGGGGSSSSSHHAPSSSSDNVEVRFLIESTHAGALIGKAGSNISRVRQASGAQATILKNEQFPHATERILQMRGSVDALAIAIRIIMDIMIAEIINKQPKGQHSASSSEEGEAAASAAAASAGSASSELVLLVHKISIGGLIGSGGSVIKATQNDTGARIHIGTECIGFSTDKQVTISGTDKQVHAACMKIIGQIVASPLKQGTKVSFHSQARAISAHSNVIRSHICSCCILAFFVCVSLFRSFPTFPAAVAVVAAVAVACQWVWSAASVEACWAWLEWPGWPAWLAWPCTQPTR